MPIFEFECETCLNQWEQLTHREEEIVCPLCGAVDPHKLISSCTFHLKGDGWADNGYAKEG